MTLLPKVVVITEPTVPLLTIDEVKRAIRIRHGDDDAMLTDLVGSVTALFAPLNIALRPATYEFRINGFPCGDIDLPLPPCLSVTSVVYDDSNGDEQTLVEDTDYLVFIRPGDQSKAPAPSYVSPIDTWPTASTSPDSVRIRYVAGYDIDGSDDDLPNAIKVWAALKVRELYEPANFKVPDTINGLIRPFLVPYV